MKIIRTSTVPGSINNFCRGLLSKLSNEGYEVVVVSSPGDAMSQISAREGVRTIAVKMQRRISPVKDLGSLWQMIKVFRHEKPDVVHSITPKAGLLSMIAAWVCRVPLRVHTFTGLVFPTSKGLKRKVLMTTDWLTCACATHIIPEGEGVKQDLINYCITRKPLKVLGFGNIRGIDLKHYNPELQDVKADSEKIRKDDVFTFIFIGRLVGDKGINELIEAFKQVQERHPRTRLLLVGHKEQNLDPLRMDTLEEIERNPAIEAVGPQADVRPWLLASEAFVFPSYREGFPNVVIEAGAMGLPSIVTDINGSREIIIDGQNGLIVPSKDIDALTRAMCDIIERPGKRNAMASAARQLIEARFEQSYVHQCLLDYYDEILKN